jgi:drug/metabolite transporter (DMT)-like permease
MTSPSISPEVWALFCVTVAMDILGQTGFKLGLERRSAGLEGRAFWLSVVTNPWVLGGLCAYALEMSCWLQVVSHAPLSVVGPLAALSYVGVVLAGKFFLGEQPGVRRWAGAGLVTFGAALLGASTL